MKDLDLTTDERLWIDTELPLTQAFEQDKYLHARRTGMKNGKWIETVVIRNEYDCWTDEQGAIYATTDCAKHLLKAPNVPHYRIVEGTDFIEPGAFDDCPDLKEVDVPYTVYDDKEYPIVCDHELKVNMWNWPYDIQVSEELQREIDDGWVDNKGFVYSKDLRRLLKAASCKYYRIPEYVTAIEESAFIGCTVESLDIPYTCTEVPDWLFECKGNVIGSVSQWDEPYPRP